jgi:hypothetical protein
MRPWRRLTAALLLPVALLVVVLEDVVWRGARACLNAFRLLRPVRLLTWQLGRLPGWAALPLFLIPEGIGKAGEFWALWLLVRGHTHSAVAVYVAVRLVAALIAVFVYHACEAALLRIGWFAALVRWIGAVRDWALALTQPLRTRLHRLVRAAPGWLVRVFNVQRRRVETRWRDRS